MRLFLFITATLIALAGISQGKQYCLLVGTYTDTKSEGIYVYKFDVSTGEATYISKTKANNPSYLAISKDEKFVYAIEDRRNNTRSETAAYEFDKKTGNLTLINKQLTNGIGACYISVDSKNKWVFVANYASGDLSVLPIKSDGSIDSLRQFFHHKGHSINATRQKEPHVHTIAFSPDEKYLFTNDLGTDKINKYAFNASADKPLSIPEDSVTLSTSGNGPRHIAFAPNKKYMYVINELSGTIDAFSYKNNHLELIQNVIVDSVNNGSTTRASADIHLSPDGKFLYATNRGNYNAIATYSVNKEDGKLTFLKIQPTGGIMPRNFTIDPTGNFLLVGHQKSDSISVFKRDKKTGLLTQTNNSIGVSSAVCLKIIAAD